jgi:hypothetical protein
MKWLKKAQEAAMRKKEELQKIGQAEERMRSIA